MSEDQEKEGAGGESPEIPPPPHPKPKKHGGHGGAWKVAYADFVTAMLALFIVLWIMAQDQKVKEAVAGYFQDPIGYGKSGGAIIPKRAPAAQTPEQKAKAELEARQKKEISRLKKLLEASELLQKIADQVVFEITDEGIRMEFRDAPKFSFFAVGSASVTNELMETFRILTPEIASQKYPVVIEGHTDRRPYGTESYTNWELAADRANSVRRIMLQYNLPLERITEVRSYADTRPLNPDDPFSATNRRVSILLKNPQITAQELDMP